MKARKQTQVALSQSQTEKTRQSVRDNFTYALLLGSCEASLTQDGGENSPKISEAEPKCYEIAKTIESAMFVYFDKSINKDYGKKFRVLQTTLSAPENTKLRAQLIQGLLNPNELTRMSADSLMSPEKKTQRQEEEDKIF